jgi:hypothetical protein
VGPVGIARAGVAALRRSPAAWRAVVLSMGLTAVAALDEYLPLLAQGAGAGRLAVPLLVGLVTAGSTLGGLFAGRGGRWLAPLLAAAGVLVALGAGSGEAAGFAGVAAAFGIVYWALAWADARLHDAVDDTARATVGSLAGAGQEVAALAAFGAYAAGSSWLSARGLFAAAALPCLALALAAAARRRR